MKMDFNEKLDVMYTKLNGKFEALNTHMEKMDTKVVQTAEAIKRQKALIKGKAEAS